MELLFLIIGAINAIFALCGLVAYMVTDDTKYLLMAVFQLNIAILCKI